MASKILTHSVDVVEATREVLTSHMMNGLTIGLRHPGFDGYVLGKITGITLESGYTYPDKPTHFNVKLDNFSKEVYVRTLP